LVGEDFEKTYRGEGARSGFDDRDGKPRKGSRNAAHLRPPRKPAPPPSRDGDHEKPVRKALVGAV
jgi:hypothetical protein